MIDGIFIPRTSVRFSRHFCFLCGAELGKRLSHEHVFPKWLLHEFDLWDKEVTLSNNSHLRYSKLGIPCCKQCNEEHLSAIEGAVRRAYCLGYSGVRSLSEELLFLWTGKMLYGLVHKECTLASDVKDRFSKSLATPARMAVLGNLHSMLQLSRFEHEFVGPPPWSVFVYRVRPMPDQSTHFWFRDGVDVPFFAIRLKTVGVIVVHLDGGLTKWFMSDLVDQVADQALHPIQFDEIAAQAFYIRTTQTLLPEYFTVVHDGPGGAVEFHAKPKPYILEPPHRPWDNAMYGRVLGEFLRQWGFSQPKVEVPGGAVASWIFNEEGHLDLSRAEHSGQLDPTYVTHIVVPPGA